MKLYLDTADVAAIKELMAYLPIDGVTTNPSILAASQRVPFEVLKEIREIIGEKQLFAQVLARDAEGMMEDASRIRSELGDETIIKVPVTSEGLVAIRELSSQGYIVLGTTVYSTIQGWLAGKAGARYVAPYVNRMDNLEIDGCGVTCGLCDIFQLNEMDTQVVGASFKNLAQVRELLSNGVDAVTVAPDLIRGALKIDAVETALDEFQAKLPSF